MTDHSMPDPQDLDVEFLAVMRTVREAWAEEAPAERVAAILITGAVGLMKASVGDAMAQVWAARAFNRAMTACFQTDAELVRDLAAAEGGIH